MDLNYVLYPKKSMLNFISMLFLSFVVWIPASKANHLVSGDTITWVLLNDLSYKEAPHEIYGTVYLPTFSKTIKKLANKTIYLRGYLVPVDKTTWALSKNTYAACFFCGKAGPETVVGLTFKDDPGKLKMDANVILKGKFILNGTNVDDWMYSLVDVEIVSTK